MDIDGQKIIKLLDMIEQADNLEALQKEANVLRKEIEVEIFLDAWSKSDRSYDEIMTFLKG